MTVRPEPTIFVDRRLLRAACITRHRLDHALGVLEHALHAQKQPPANTATSCGPAASVTRSAAGAGIFTAASAAMLGLSCAVCERGQCQGAAQGEKAAGSVSRVVRLHHGKPRVSTTNIKSLQRTDFLLRLVVCAGRRRVNSLAARPFSSSSSLGVTSRCGHHVDLDGGTRPPCAVRQGARGELVASSSAAAEPSVVVEVLDLADLALARSSMPGGLDHGVGEFVEYLDGQLQSTGSSGDGAVAPEKAVDF